MSKPQRDKSILDNVDPEKREFIGKLIGTGTFIAPIVASFAMQISSLPTRKRRTALRLKWQTRFLTV